MRAVVQRVTRANVTVDGKVAGAIGPGLCVLVGATHTDGPAEIATVARKIAQQRILRAPAPGPAYVPSTDDDPATRVSAEECGAPILLISQFTLYADIRKGRRPGWSHAAPGPVAEPLVAALAAELRETYSLPVEEGVFGAMMNVELVNDGPFTLVIEV